MADLVAAVPVSLADPQTDCARHDNTFVAGTAFERANGERLILLTRVARLAYVVFPLLGAVVSVLWARERASTAGTLALALWVLDPNIIGHGSLVTGDIAAAATGGMAFYALWHWLRAPSAGRAALAGLALGIAELTKFVWLIAYPLWFVLWVVWRISARAEADRPPWRIETLQFAGIVLLSVYVINVGYAFEGTFTTLGEYRFASRSLGGGEAGDRRQKAGDRSQGGRAQGSEVRRVAEESRPWWAGIPVPLPVNYLRGMDEIATVVEPDDQWSYLEGEWQQGGRWYYYLYGLAVKLPVGTLVLFGLALVLTVRRWLKSERRTLNIQHRTWNAGDPESRSEARERQTTDDGQRATDTTHHSPLTATPPGATTWSCWLPSS